MNQILFKLCNTLDHAGRHPSGCRLVSMVPVGVVVQGVPVGAVGAVGFWWASDGPPTMQHAQFCFWTHWRLLWVIWCMIKHHGQNTLFTMYAEFVDAIGDSKLSYDSHSILLHIIQEIGSIESTIQNLYSPEVLV